MKFQDEKGKMVVRSYTPTSSDANVSGLPPPRIRIRTWIWISDPSVGDEA